MTGFDSEKNEYIDSLRLSPKEQDELLARMAQASAATDAQERRGGARVNYQRQAGLIVQMHHMGGTTTNYLVRARNLSTTGIAFLHGAFVYPHTRCAIALMTLNNKILRAEGEVVRCRLVSKHIHEVGVRFDQPVRMQEFVARQFLAAADQQPSTELPQLGGHVLYVEDSIIDQELLKFHLSHLGTRVLAVANGLAALDLASHTKFDAVITDVWLPVMTGTEMAQNLRDTGYAGPIIALTADEREETRKDVLARGCTCLLAKPYRLEQLAEVLSQYMPKGSAHSAGGQTLMSELWGDAQIRPLIRAFLKHLDEQLVQLQRYLDSGKRDLVVQKLCMDVKGSAGGYGYSPISAAAGELLQMLVASADTQPLTDQFRTLMELCASARRGIQNSESGDETSKVA